MVSLKEVKEGNLGTFLQRFPNNQILHGLLWGFQ